MLHIAQKLIYLYISSHTRYIRMSQPSQQTQLAQPAQQTQEVVVVAADLKTQIEAYIQQLNAKETQAMAIAQRILGSSFDIEQCIGFRKYSQTP